MTIPVPATHREVRLAARPHGRLGTDRFRTVEVPVPEAGPGQVLVRNRLMSVTAVMDALVRGDTSLPMPPYGPGDVLAGPAIGVVIAATDTGLEPGDLIAHNGGWREYALVDETDAQRIQPGALPDAAAHLSRGSSRGWASSGEPKSGPGTRCSSPLRQAVSAPWPTSSPVCGARRG